MPSPFRNFAFGFLAVLLLASLAVSAASCGAGMDGLETSGLKARNCYGLNIGDSCTNDLSQSGTCVNEKGTLTDTKGRLYCVCSPSGSASRSTVSLASGAGGDAGSAATTVGAKTAATAKTTPAGLTLYNMNKLPVSFDSPDGADAKIKEFLSEFDGKGIVLGGSGIVINAADKRDKEEYASYATLKDRSLKAITACPPAGEDKAKEEACEKQRGRTNELLGFLLDGARFSTDWVKDLAENSCKAESPKESAEYSVVVVCPAKKADGAAALAASTGSLVDMLKALRIYASSPPAPVSPDHEVRPGGQAASTGSGASGALAAPAAPAGSGKASVGYAGVAACKDFSVTVKEGTFSGKDADKISLAATPIGVPKLAGASFRMTVMLVPLTSEGKPASQNVISKTFCGKKEGFGKLGEAGKEAAESIEGCSDLPASFDSGSVSLKDLGVSVTADKAKGGPFYYAFKGTKEFKVAENEKVQVKVFMRQWIAVKSATTGAADEKKYCPTGTTNDGKTGAVSASYGVTGLKPAKKAEAKLAPAPSSGGSGGGSGSPSGGSGGKKGGSSGGSVPVSTAKIGQACRVGSVSGTCIQTRACTAKGNGFKSVPDYCPGLAAQYQCCVKSATGNSGTVGAVAPSASSGANAVTGGSSKKLGRTEWFVNSICSSAGQGLCKAVAKKGVCKWWPAGSSANYPSGGCGRGFVDRASFCIIGNTYYALYSNCAGKCCV